MAAPQNRPITDRQLHTTPRRLRPEVHLCSCGDCGGFISQLDLERAWELHGTRWINDKDSPSPFRDC